MVEILALNSKWKLIIYLHTWYRFLTEYFAVCGVHVSGILYLLWYTDVVHNAFHSHRTKLQVGETAQQCQKPITHL